MLTLITPPADLLTLEEAKLHMRVSYSRDDAAIQRYIRAAVAYMDGPTGVYGKAIMAQTWEWKVERLGDPARLPFGPISTVDSIKYLDASGVEQTIAPENYYLMSDAEGPYVRLIPGQTWPVTFGREDDFRIRFTAGAATSADVPPNVISAALMLAAHLEENRTVQVYEQTFPTGFGFYDLIHASRQLQI